MKNDKSLKQEGFYQILIFHMSTMSAYTNAFTHDLFY